MRRLLAILLAGLVLMAARPQEQQWSGCGDVRDNSPWKVWMLVQVDGLGMLPQGQYWCESMSLDGDGQWIGHCGRFLCIFSTSANRRLTYLYRVWKAEQEIRAKRGLDGEGRDQPGQ